MDTSNDSVRRFVLDRTVEDNAIDLELFFSEEEIDFARELAVGHYNETPPYVRSITLTTGNKHCLPYPLAFLHGIAYHLYLSKLQKLQKEDLDYNAGGMQVDLIKRRINHLAGNIGSFKQEFLQLITQQKVAYNYQGATGQIG